MAAKKETKSSKAKTVSTDAEGIGKITTTAELKTFLTNMLDKVKEDAAPPIYIASAMNHVLNISDIYTLLDNESRELARDIWLRLKASGFQVKNPPLLFPEGDGAAI
jgi:hypothetical protein